MTRTGPMLLLTLAIAAMYCHAAEGEPRPSPGVVWAATNPDLSKPLTLEFEVHLPLDGSVSELERYFSRHRFDIEIRKFPRARKGSAIVIARKHGVFAAQWIDAVASDVDRLAPRQTGGHVSFTPDRANN